MATTSQSSHFRLLLIQHIHLHWVLILKVNFPIISAVHIFLYKSQYFEVATREKDEQLRRVQFILCFRA